MSPLSAEAAGLEGEEVVVLVPVSMAAAFRDRGFRGMADLAEVLLGYHLSGRYHR